MKIIRKGEAKRETGKTFTGHVELDRLLGRQELGGLAVSLVRFDDGARTFWHSHPGEQVLIILQGKGRVGNEREQWDVESGDLVYSDPEERHWHGAAAGNSMAHISITTGGPPVWYGPPDETP